MSNNSKLKIYGYNNEQSNEIEDFIYNLPKEETYRILTVLKIIAKEGAKVLALNRLPYETKKIQNNLFEIKINSNRLMYCYIDHNGVCILSAFKKDSQKTRKKEIDKAVQRLNQMLNYLDK
ncbi:MAG: type II toxin-antitoxin system RelE/ParE family toxin [Bacillota bacterium]|nr:type II toxin-antitoxin system RelE/ParE family toxin [Bacillota bacterium]